MKKLIIISLIAAVAAFAAACGSSTGGDAAATGKPIKSGPAGNLTATLSNADGVLKKGKQDLKLSFTDAAGKPVDVGSASLNFYMPAMGSMAAMNDAATLTTSGTPGVYNAKVDLQMGGEWQAQISYEGAAGKGKATLTVSAQ